MTRRSVWQDRHRSTPRTSEALDGRAEVVVIGAGITGLVTALLLARAGRAVTVLEAGDVGSGSTGRSTAKVSVLQGTRLTAITGRHGVDVARQYVRANQEGQAWLREFCERHAVDHQERVACTFDWPGETGARSEHDAALAAGLPVTWHEELPVPWATGGGVALGAQFQVDPLALLHMLAAEAEAHGAVIATGQRVRRIGLHAPYRVHTDHGVIDADQVVVATNMPVLDRGGFFARMVPQRSYAVVARVPGHGVDGMYLSAQSPGRSVRDLGDAALMVGGEGHVTGRSTPTSERLERLGSWTHEVFPGAELTHGWSAQDYASAHELPYAGPLLPGHDGLLMAGGYAKWGFTNGTAAGIALAGRMLGGHQEWASVMAPWRGRELRGAVSAAKANASVALELGRGWIRPKRALDGKVCPHLGGVVTWNDAESSWDCPLHGSRFEQDGEVLEGPATRGLRPRS